MNEIQCDVTSSTKVFIKGNSPASNVHEPLYAINWFSTKIEWIYHFYNLLASRSLVKVGGEAFFKGRILKTILDENKTTRDLILIVYYPSGKNFKALMESTYFKLVSIFRMFSVKKFSFSFTQKQIKSDSKLENNLAHVIHHFNATNIDDSFFSQFEALLKTNIEITYSGKTIANLLAQKKNKEVVQIPNLMDGIIIFESENESDILNMIGSPEYQSLLKRLDSSYIGTLKRIL